MIDNHENVNLMFYDFNNAARKAGDSGLQRNATTANPSFRVYGAGANSNINGLR